MRCFGSPFKTRAHCESSDGAACVRVVCFRCVLRPAWWQFNRFAVRHAARGGEQEPENTRPQRRSGKKIGISPRRDHDLSDQSGNSGP